MRLPVDKTCRFCGRRFSKAEHLGRHLRSHTGEKPFKCSYCAKSYGRSDVLRRHIKDHHDGASEGSDNFNTFTVQDSTIQNVEQCSGPGRYDHPLGVFGQDVQRSLMNLQAIDASPELDRYDLCGSLAPFEAYDSGLSQFTMSIAQNSGVVDSASSRHGRPTSSLGSYKASEDSIYAEFLSGQSNEPSMLDMAPWTSLGLDDSLSSTSLPPTADLGVDQLEPLNGHETTRLTEDFLWLEWACQLQHERDVYVSPPSDSIRDRSMLLPHHNGRVDAADRLPAECSRVDSLATSMTYSDLQSKQTTIAPEMAFAASARQIVGSQRLWPSDARLEDHLLCPKWWNHIIVECTGNLFSIQDSSARKRSQPVQALDATSYCGFDRECRSRLVRKLELQHGGQNSSGLPDVPFPSSEVLAVSLNLYFRHFHPRMPFIHRATFRASTCDESVLLAMCLVGLTYLDDKDAHRCVGLLLPAAVRRCRKGLGSSTDWESKPSQLLAYLASAMLLLCVSRMTPAKFFDGCVRMMYSEAISLAQRHSLFPVSSGDDALQAFQNTTNGQEEWEAWARVESIKRLCVCLSMGDAMFSHEYERKPILHFELAKYVAPYNIASFDAPDADAWRNSLHGSQKEVRLHVLSLPRSTGDYEMHGLFAICWALISKGRHRLSALADEHSPYVDSARALSQDPQIRVAVKVLSAVHGCYRGIFDSLNPNCLVSWHNTCMNLTADRFLFQDAAGRNGLARAKAALKIVTQWSETAAARRACLHAAQTFRLLSRRSISDGMMFQSETALFESALVLGLYSYVRPQTQRDSGPCEQFELLSDVDWTDIGGLGLSYSDEDGLVTKMVSGESPSRRFIRDGLPVSFEGVACSGGFRSAQQIFLAFLTLVRQVATWNAERYLPILRSLSFRQP
ncbi:Fungal specific transcription factor domain-containing protein [Cladophialophora immunda]|nr:Fungal specific transcription factor domain-containing protein [Cladophialophora immunda]